jgi:hypothetical protein
MDTYDFSKYYYLDLLMLLSTIIALIVSIRNRNKIRPSLLFSLYLGCFLLLSAVCMYDDINHNGGTLINVGNNCFLILELSVFTFFLHQNLQSNRLRNILLFSVILIICFILFDWIRNPGSLTDDLSIPFILESGFLIFPCLFYYLELLNQPGPIRLDRLPSFWIVTGILLFNCCCIPIYLFETHVSSQLKTQFGIVFSRNYFLYILLFLLFTRAYLCNKQTTA